jgi:N-acetylmuramoyl-L-alanine amidase
MRFYYGFLGVLVGVSTVLAQPQNTLASAPEDVSQLAQDNTVIIQGPKLGSGVIVRQQGDIYLVLTNWHVVDQVGSYTIQTRDGKQYLVDSNLIKRIAGVDLAVVPFKSSQQYTVAELGKSEAMRVGKTVYVSGAPEPLRGIEERTILVIRGEIIGKQKPQNGYTWIYNNNTYDGMSGGGVFDENGLLIGIHGLGAIGRVFEEKVGFNLGIPINSSIASQLGRNLTQIAQKIQPPPSVSSPSSSTTVRPTKIQPPSASNSRVLIVIDPGHGGKDSGGIGMNGLLEKDVALPISQKVAEILQQNGVQVVMTRNTDSYISLQERVDIAERANANLFVSIHANSNSTRPDINGLETYYYDSGYSLAQVVHNNILQSVNVKNRGVRKARFYVLRKATTPSILIETGHLTGNEDAPKFASSEYRNQIATAIGRGILQYLQQKSKLSLQSKGFE